ncbi:hypothetical protein MAR_027188 [Mya arenaria]|uniref:Uncharacterized protein n=1 Tax=Mya arenaria TaxID=6604 RepID=A0ABY7ESQ6_MYAAR|nr:hypothetical protein MAR_027188 [Mya arenaria]
MVGPCDRGFYCPEGSASNIQCHLGTYCQTATLSTPTGNCSVGYYCTLEASSFMPTDNTTGNICYHGSLLPRGKLHSHYDNSDCIICTGKYCPGTGNPEPVGTCDPGYYCPIGDSSAGYSLCLEGFYCPEGTGRNWSWCPEGTFSNVLGLDNISDCRQCLGGKHCDVTNLTAPVADCDAGYFCTLGVDTSQPDGVSNTGTGGICPQGSRCPTGSLTPESCPTGTYQDLDNQADCKTCPSGYYCLAGSTNYTDTPCLSGHYCLDGTTADNQYPCPAGTFNSLTGNSLCHVTSYDLTREATPQRDVTPGSYCSMDMLDAVTGNCSAGYYCTGNSTTDHPTGTGGYYCPAGQITSTPSSYECPAGYFCVTGVSPEADECPVGHYCPEGTVQPVHCPNGTFSNAVWPVNKSECYNCNALVVTAPAGLCARAFTAKRALIMTHLSSAPREDTALKVN